MALSKTAKIEAEITKTKAKIAEQQGKLKELEQKRTEIENMEIVDIVRGMSIPLDHLAAMLTSIKNGVGTSGAVAPQAIVPKSSPTKKETEDTSE